MFPHVWKCGHLNKQKQKIFLDFQGDNSVWDRVIFKMPVGHLGRDMP